jgi:hypothetical protein
MTQADRVADLIAEAARRRAAAADRRHRLQKAREHGLAARHRLKLARLQPQTDDTDDDPPDPRGDAA